MNIALQGQRGSYHHQAAIEHFGDDVSLLSKRGFRGVFESLANKESDYAIVASENSLYGSINEVYDLMLEHDLHIVGERYLRIEHALIGTSDAALESVTDVYSQDVALAQCDVFLRQKLPGTKRHMHFDTAGAVADVVAWGDPAKAAIAGEFAAKEYNAKILQSNVETNHQNYTRFVVLSRNEKSDKSDTKTSIILRTAGNNGNDDQKAGSLYRALSSFASRGINLSKLESRPVIGKAWHYLFYIDFDCGLHEDTAQDCLQELVANGNTVRVLGTYAGQSL